MTGKTKAIEAGFNVRARGMLRRLLAKIAAPNTALADVTLADVATLTSNDVLDARNCGKHTLAHVRAVLLEADLRLADDAPGLWKSDRAFTTELFVEKCGGDATVIRSLCDELPTHVLVKLAKAHGWEYPEKETSNGEGQANEREDRVDPRQAGGSRQAEGPLPAAG